MHLIGEGTNIRLEIRWVAFWVIHCDVLRARLWWRLWGYTRLVSNWDIVMKEKAESKATLSLRIKAPVLGRSYFRGVQRLDDFVLNLLNEDESTSE